MDIEKSTYEYGTKTDTHLSIIRIIIGLAFIYHFAGKFGLLGQTSYQDDVNFFASVGLSKSFVMLAGLCEFGAFFALTFGLFTRIAAVASAVYLMIAMYCGYHFAAGYIWNSHVSGIMINGTSQTVYGGWEYPVVWALLCLSFVITGGRKWTIDAMIRKSSKSRWLRKLSY